MEGAEYILSNWSAAKVRLKIRRIPGCSTEGHISHVLSKRMSTAAMGWSRKGADNMATKQIKDYLWHQNAWNIDKKPAVAERRPGYIFCLENQKLKGL